MTKPIIALLYDFDKTLCTTDMEDYAFIPALRSAKIDCFVISDIHFRLCHRERICSTVDYCIRILADIDFIIHFPIHHKRRMRSA